MHTVINRRLFQRLVVISGLAATGVLAGCEAAAPPTGVPGTGSAELRIVNGAAGAVSVFVDGSARVTNMLAGTVSPALSIGSGTRHVEFRSPGSGATLAFVDVTPNAAGKAIVTATTGLGGTVKAGVVVDTAAVVAAGTSKLRVLHLAANAPAIDIWRTQPDFSTPIRFMFPFAYSASSGYMASTPGAWVVYVTLVVAPAPGDSLGGGPPSTVPARSLATYPITIGGGVIKTVVVLDVAGGGVKIEELP